MLCSAARLLLKLFSLLSVSNCPRGSSSCLLVSYCHASAAIRVARAIIPDRVRDSTARRSSRTAPAAPPHWPTTRRIPSPQNDMLQRLTARPLATRRQADVQKKHASVARNNATPTKIQGGRRGEGVQSSATGATLGDVITREVQDRVAGEPPPRSDCAPSGRETPRRARRAELCPSRTCPR